MISFEIRYNEASGLWQFRGGKKSHWSEPMKLGKLDEVLRKQVADTPVPVNSERFNEQWSKPLVHRKRSVRQLSTAPDGTPLYEIQGKKVVRIASSKAEREAQQLAELAEILDLGDL